MKEVYYIAICDDEEEYRNELHSLLKQYADKNNMLFQIEEFSSAKELLHVMETMEDYYQIVFFDVDMPEMKGTDAAKQMRRLGSKAVICFVTSYEQYAFEAFQVEALDYIVKRVSYEKLEIFMTRATDLCRLHEEKTEAVKQYLTLKEKGEKRTVKQESILYIEKRRNQCMVYTDTEEILCYNTLQNLYENLNQVSFVYTHQGYIVNFYRIKEIWKDKVFLGNNIEIPVSRKYKENLKKRFDDKLECLRRDRFIHN